MLWSFSPPSPNLLFFLQTLEPRNTRSLPFLWKACLIYILPIFSQAMKVRVLLIIKSRKACNHLNVSYSHENLRFFVIFFCTPRQFKAFLTSTACKGAAEKHEPLKNTHVDHLYTIDIFTVEYMSTAQKKSVKIYLIFQGDDRYDPVVYLSCDLVLYVNIL